MKLKVKVCGMRAPSNIQSVVELEPDYMGFIYYGKSSRYVGEDFQVPTIGKKVKRVGVFVNHPLEFVFREIERNSLHAVQLHGDETPDFCSNIKSKGISVIKAFSIDKDFDFTMTMAYKYSADYFLFDTKGKNYGGTGLSFDWTLLEKYSQPTPFFLSGGLSVENISQVATIKNPQLYAVDLNSGVEESAGVKNIEKIKIIMDRLNELK
jgi:phosphoribosylanthranilate isomerase